MKRGLFIAAAALAGGAYLVARRGRDMTRKELGADDQFAADVAASLSFVDALKAGARSLVGTNPLGYQATATVTGPTGFESPYGYLELM